MKATARRTLAVLAAALLLAPLTACGGGTAAGTAPRARTIAVLLPERASPRYERFDRPLVSSAVAALCSTCTVLYGNADGDAAAQQKQFEDFVAEGVRVVLLDPVNAATTAPWIGAAAARGVKVISYDRLAAGPVAAHITFDSERTGELEGRALADALGDRAAGAGVVMIDGPEADPNTAAVRSGVHRALDGRIGRIVYEQSAEGEPDRAAAAVKEAVGHFGRGSIQAVYTSDDALAAVVAPALRAAGLDVPVGGQNADLDAVRRLLTGDQAYTVYKPYKAEADAAATLAVYLVQGLDITSVAAATTTSGGLRIPTTLLAPVVVTRGNVAQTVVAGRLYTVDRICTPSYAQACRAAGLTP